MSSVKIPTTKPYQDSLLQSLRDRPQAAAYLLAALADAATEPDLLEAVLRDVDAALGSGAVDVGPMVGDRAKLIVSQPLHEAMPQLVSWLDDLGLQLSVTVKQ
jgi:hypothetical protein